MMIIMTNLTSVWNTPMVIMGDSNYDDNDYNDYNPTMIIMTIVVLVIMKKIHNQKIESEMWNQKDKKLRKNKQTNKKTKKGK